MRCPYRPASRPAAPSLDDVERAMRRLMPGWFTKQDELMSAEEPGSSIIAIREICARHPEKSLDDAIHEYFADDWFCFFPDGCEDW